MNPQKVIVLLGGTSSEKEVSLVSGHACADALRRLGHDVTLFDPGTEHIANLLQHRPAIVFNALHGVPGEDGVVQGLLETLGFAYTHSGVNASSVCMNKYQSRELLRAAGLNVAHAVRGRWEDLVDEPHLPFPFVLKPVCDGSSVGVYIIKDGHDWQHLDRFAQASHADFLCEAFIDGPEYTVAVLGGRALEVTEISVQKGFYDYQAKYTPGGSDHTCPAIISQALRDECMKAAELAHHALGCRGVSRTDFRFDSIKQQLQVLEINTQPGMTPTSLVPEQATYVGMGFDQLVAWILEDASCQR